MKHIKIIGFMFLFSFGLFAAESTQQKNGKKKILTTTGFMQEITEKRSYTGKVRSGEQIYLFRCKGCHGKNTQGAPMPDDKFEWSNRLKKGIDVLYKHSIDGYKNYLMPPMGGCRNCSEQEIYSAVIYMLERSGNKVPKNKNTK